MTTHHNFRLVLMFAGLLVFLFPIPDSCRVANGQDWHHLGDQSDGYPSVIDESLSDDVCFAPPISCRNNLGCEGQQPESRFKLTEFNIYPTFSFLGDQVGNYAEFEFASKTQLGRFELENRTVMNVADLPGTIQLGAANPDLGPGTANVRGNGFGDMLSGFFFSRKARRTKSHLGIGPVVTMPTASNELLGSGQWTIGPGAHFNTEIGRLTTGFFIWQSWGLTESPAKKQVNQLFGKPFFLYELNEKWNLIYIPLGLSHSWKSSDGDDWTVPIGGGLRRLIKMRGKTMGLQFQAFDYVARKPTDPEWELRCTIEFLFD